MWLNNPGKLPVVVTVNLSEIQPMMLEIMLDNTLQLPPRKVGDRYIDFSSWARKGRNQV